MAAWFGFSDEDLKKVKNMAKTSTDPPHIKPNESQKKAKFAQAKGPQQQRPLRPAKQRETAEIDSSMRLQKSPTHPVNESTSHKIPKGRRENKHESQPTVENDEEKQKAEQEDKEKEKEAESLDDKEGFDRDLMSLEKFREQQKAIEEANKQKRALLSKTITERRKRARAESHKLEHIQKELSKLDQILSGDVEVIRNRIEDISRDYMEAERRFQRAETEYIAAKVDLHQKSEQKESLTEHMYTIIHQNEVRKAKKLAELMKEMEMEFTEEELQLPELPPLSSFQQSILPTSPTGFKHIVKPLDTSSTGETTSVPAETTQTTGDSTSTSGEKTSVEGENTNTTGETTCSAGETTNGARDSNAAVVKVEKDSSSVDSKDDKRTESETNKVKETQPAQNSVPDTNSIESQSVTVSETAKTNQAVDPSAVKQEPVNELVATVTQNESSNQNSVAVKNEQNSEESTPKIPTKWDFDGSLS